MGRRSFSSRRTAIPEFVKLISDYENVFEIPVNGVGSDVNWIDKFIGGKSLLRVKSFVPDSNLQTQVLAGGTLRNVVTALSRAPYLFTPIGANKTQETSPDIIKLVTELSLMDTLVVCHLTLSPMCITCLMSPKELGQHAI